jgi:hypothetical protein
MNKEKLVNADTLNSEVQETLPEDTDETLEDTQDTQEDIEETQEDSQENDEVEKLRAEAEKFKQEARNQKIRAEKAERASKSSASPDLTPTDIYALLKADVEEEDFQEVVDYARLKGVPIKDALKSSVVQGIITEKKEERKTAEATATGNKRSRPKPPTGDELLNRVRTTGEVPERDEDIQALVSSAINRK